MLTFNYICSECGQRFDIDPHRCVCPFCSERQADDQPLSGVLEVELQGTTSGKEVDVAELLPVESRFFPPIPVGNTPLWEPGILRKELGFDALYIKDDGANPTSSFKDRASV
ncbi:MAG: hypothetical protein P8Y40_06700, partial [Desulfobacterales bacterium]